MEHVFLAKDIEASLARVLGRLEPVLSNVKSDVLSLAESGVVLHTKYQFIFNLKFQDVLDSRLFELILGHALEAEKMGPGAFDLFFHLLLENLRDRSIVSMDKQITASPSTKNDLEDVVLRPLEQIDLQLSKIVECALDLAGFGGKIIVEKAHAGSPSLELSRGYNFDISPAWPVTTKLENPRAFVIDGYIESVSEVHHLLLAVSESKEPAVAFVRGVSDEVVQTLRVNFERGTLKIVPLVVKFDLEGINMINDIAVVTGCNLVSSNKGDLISTVKLDDAPVLHSVTVYPNKAVIRHDKTHKAVAAHVSFLRKKQSEHNVVEDVGTLFDKRIRALSPSHCVIRLPDTRDFIKKSQAIDVALRGLKALVDHGTLRSNGVVLPASTQFSAGFYAARCAHTLASMGAVVIY